MDAGGGTESERAVSRAGYVERNRRNWENPEIRQKMLDGSAKGAATKLGPREKAEQQWRTRRAVTKKLKRPGD